MKENLLVDTWKISKIAGVEAENKDGILKVHFRDPAEFNYYHSEIQSSVEPSTYYKLSGYIKAEQLIDKYGYPLVLWTAEAGQKHIQELRPLRLPVLSTGSM